MAECIRLYARPSARVGRSVCTAQRFMTTARTGARVGRSVCTAQRFMTTAPTGVRFVAHHTDECAARRMMAECIRVYARPSARVGRMHGPTVYDDGSDGHTTRRFVAHDTDECAAQIFVMHESDGRAARLVGTRPRFGRDAQIGCTRAKLYGYD